MNISDPTIKVILKEEVELFLRGQKILAEHKKLVRQRKDFHSQAALFLIEELTGKPVDPTQLDEGFWEKAKFMLGKMGSLERGKLFGRKSKRYKAAVEKLEAALDQAANKIAKDLRATLASKYKDFPNNESQEDFVNGLMDIGEAYDTIRAQVVAGEMPYDEGQPVVEALRNLVIFYLDNELADSYKHFKEHKELTEAEEEVRGKYTKVGAGEEDFAAGSETIKGLKSNIAPAVLAAAGGLSIILGNAGWFLDLLKGAPANPQQAVQTIQKTLGPMDGEGFTQMLGRLAEGDPTAFNASLSPKELFAAMQSQGIDPTNPQALFDLGVDPSAYQQALASGASTIGEMFPASNQALWLDKGSQVVTNITKAIGQSVAKKAGGAALAAAGANPVLIGMGLGAVVAGAAVKALRMKGLKTSRAAMLKDLANELQNLPQPEGEVAPGPEAPEGEEEEDVGPTTPPPPTPPPANVTRLGLVRMDDDGTKVYVGTRRNKDQRERELALMKKAQDETPVGRGTDPSTDELDKEFKKGRRGGDPADLDYGDLKKLVKGRSKKEPEVFITVDASIRKDIARALKAVGAIKRAAVTNKIKAAVDAASEKLVDKFAASKKKQTPRQARIIAARELKRAGIEGLEFDDYKGIVKVFQDYGLVRPGELTPGRKRKKKGAEKPAPKTGNPPPPRGGGTSDVKAARDRMRAAREEAGLEERLGDLKHVGEDAHALLFEKLTRQFTK